MLPAMARPRLLAMATALLLAGCGVPGRELFLPPTALRRAEAIVVLGFRPPLDAQGRVSSELERRLRRGLALYREGLAPRVVVTGGPGPGGVVEADVMAGYLERAGVPAERILRDREALDTADNARESVALVCAGREPCEPDVIVVSSPYHLRRALELFRCAGARPQPAETELADDLGYRVGFAAYEYGVRVVYVADDACGRARRTPGLPSDASAL